MMVGVPGSGKSYIAKQLQEQYNAYIFSSDLMRLKLFGNENYQGDNDLVFRTLYHEMEIAVLQGKNVILWKNMKILNLRY